MDDSSNTYTIHSLSYTYTIHNLSYTYTIYDSSYILTQFMIRPILYTIPPLLEFINKVCTVQDCIIRLVTLDTLHCTENVVSQDR